MKQILIALVALAALTACGMVIRFDKVAMKPGKPTVFATGGARMAFGLPGNPVSAFVAFENFVRPALGRMCGLENPDLPQVRGVLTRAMKAPFRMLRGRGGKNARRLYLSVEPDLPGRGAPRMSAISYFARFGVTEAMIAEALGAALSRGGDHADIFFQHRVSNDLALEDGSVNRAYASVELGVGVRVVQGDQTGYGFTEDLSLSAIKACAQTAAAIADGPSRPGPLELRVAPPRADTTAVAARKSSTAPTDPSARPHIRRR